MKRPKSVTVFVTEREIQSLRYLDNPHQRAQMPFEERELALKDAQNVLKRVMERYAK